MVGTILLVMVVAFLSWTMAGYVTHNSPVSKTGHRSTAYFVCVIICVAASALIGLGINVPDRSPQETAFRALLVILPSALLGVRMALGKPQNT